MIRVVSELKGLTEDEKHLLLTIISLASLAQNLTTCERDVLQNMADRQKKVSRARLIGWITELNELGVFVRDELIRPGVRPAARYTLVDPIKLSTSKALEERQIRLDAKVGGPSTQPIIDPTIDALEGITDPRVAYSRKIDNLLLRRVSADPDHLGKPVALTLPGMRETVHVVQRSLSGIPPMDGSETRLQQALLTMFKKYIDIERSRRELNPSDVPRRWRVDLRQVCKTMGLAVSSGNMLSQARALQRLYANEFLVIFQPNSQAAARFGHTLDEIKEVRVNEETGALEHRVDTLQRREKFLEFLEPVLFEAISEQSELFSETGGTPVSTPLALQDRSSEDIAIFDKNGRLFRFWNVEFGERVHLECVTEVLGMPQIFSQPGSLLKEDSVVVRGLISLAQRSLSRRNRAGVFSETWGAIANEIRPLSSEIATFRAMANIFSTQFSQQNPGEQWRPTSDETGGLPCLVQLHGYLFETIIPSRTKHNRRRWILRMAIDPSNDVIGDNGIVTNRMNDRFELSEQARAALQIAKSTIDGRTDDKRPTEQCDLPHGD